MALADLLLNAIPEAKITTLFKLVARVPFASRVVARMIEAIALAAHDPLPAGVADQAVQLLKKGRQALGLAGCAACFAAGTMVAVPSGAQPIQALHVGDTVLAEDPATGVVEAEPVEAVIQDPVSPLIAVQLSDGSAITVTADHPFWVDSGALFTGPGWLAAGHLLPGDRLRTASGRDATVAGVRRGVGQAVVYTLTVAKDHTFFVGNARVLVHNAACPLHHLFPQKFRAWFASHGITDIDKFTIEVDVAFHKALHNSRGLPRPAGNGGVFNKEWYDFIAAHPNAARDEILRFAVQLKIKYGIYGPYLPY